MTAGRRQPEQGAGRGAGLARRRSTTVKVAVSGGDAAARRLAEKAVRVTLAAEGKRSGTMEVAVVDDAEMRRLHKLWLNKDTSTDVLTFDLTDAQDPARIDGQILVCHDVARREARQRGSDWRHELVLYIVHGCLHLCGYDDRQVSAFRRMHRREDEILTELGLGAIFSQAAAPPPKGRNSRNKTNRSGR